MKMTNGGMSQLHMRIEAKMCAFRVIIESRGVWIECKDKYRRPT